MDRNQRRLLPSTSAITAFHAVARLGSFTAAAVALDLTVGAVSRQLDLLEERLGVELLVRTNKGVQLTDRGRRYADGCAEVIRKLSAMSLDAMASNPTGRLNLSILPTFWMRWLLPRIQDFARRYPHITMSIATHMDPFDLSRDGIDAAIHVGNPDWKGCECEFLLPEIMVPVCSPGFLESNPLSGPDSMRSMPLLEMSGRPYAWKNWFDSVGVSGEYRSGMRVEHFMSASQACCAGLGVALLPEFLIENELSSGSLVKIFETGAESGSAYYFVFPAGKSENESVRAFGDWLQQQVKGCRKSFLHEVSSLG